MHETEDRPGHLVERVFYCVGSVIFEHLPLWSDQASCCTALALESVGLVDHDFLAYEVDKARASLQDERHLVDSTRHESPAVESLLVHAARSNWPLVIKALLASDSWAQHVGVEKHLLCVFLAAERGYGECLAALVAARPDAVSRKDGTSALHVAAQNGHHAICEWLVDIGNISINVRNNLEQTPLMYAVGNLETVNWFLSREDVNIDHRDAENMSAFQHASQERAPVAVNVMNLLLARRCHRSRPA
jgi:hypothetical protein